MDPAYAARYGDLYRRHWWWRAREALIVAELRRLPLVRGRILDVGSGDGLLFPRLAEFGQPEGVEPDAAMVPPDSPNRARVHLGPFETFQPGRRYSLILMLDVLEHVAGPEAFLRHAVTLLDAGGRLVVTVPAFPILWTTHDEVNRHVTRYTRARLRSTMEQTGLRVERMRYFFHWLFLAKLVVRAWEAATRPAPASAEVPSPWINRSAWALSRGEQAVFSGLPLPFGSSLLAVAHAA